VFTYLPTWYNLIIETETRRYTMHTKNDYKFETLCDAKKFADAEKVSYNRSCDVYVTGPMLIDESVTFKDMDWVVPAAPYYMVGVEIYK